MAPVVAFVIPTLNEVQTLPGLLDDLTRCELDHQVIVCDGGSHDDTRSVARAAGAVVERAARGRGRQLNTGARRATAEWLCFLHADVRLSRAALADLERCVLGELRGAAVWRLRIDGPRLLYRIVEWGARLRAAGLGLPYGDQGLLVRRDRFESMGGYPEIPAMEDVVFMQRLDAVTRVVRLSSVVTVSARRWERAGIVRQTLSNGLMITAWSIGVSPRRLARWYRPESGP